MRCFRASAKPRWLSGVIVAAIVANAASAQAEHKTEPPSIWQQPTLTGDWGGARTALKDRGIEFKLNDTSELLSVLSGGVERRSIYAGQLALTIDANLQTLIGWNGATMQATVFQIQNTKSGIIAYTGSLADPSNIDALHTTRLYTAWFEQDFGDRASLRIGQITADVEFITSDTAGGLINGTFGWAGILAADMLSGGPAYPLAAPGARLKLKPADDLTVLAAVFSGDPAGPNCNDIPQKCNRYGTTFSFDGGVLAMSEAQYAVNQGKQAVGLPGVYKLGAWYATADFYDQHFGLNAAGMQVSLADPSAAYFLTHRGNGGVYGVADQMVWRGAASSMNVFLRGGVSPSDRNLVSYYADGSVGLKGPLSGRPDDTLTFGVAYSKISSAAAALDRDFLAFNGPPYAIRGAETVFELSYAAQIAPWWVVQPDIQYIRHPSGGQNPNDPTLTLGHAFVAGIRSTIKF
jgi:porin